MSRSLEFCPANEFIVPLRCRLGAMLARALLFALAVASLFAQSAGPDVYHKKAANPKAALTLSPPSEMAGLPAPPRMKLPALSGPDIPLADRAFGPDRVGVHRKLTPGAGPGAETSSANRSSLDGGWTVLPGGARVWRMAIESPKAYGIRVHFEDFDAGVGHVWIYAANKDTGAWAGAYQFRGPQGDGDFWSDVVFSDAVVIEFLPGPSAPAGQQVPFRIAEISHLWRDIGAFLGVGAASSRALRAGQPSPDQAAPCSLDVSCYPEWASTSQAVARILFETTGGSALCSGTLLNDTGDANRLYFLTAAHCISAQNVARSVVAFWSYQTSTCNGTPPNASAVPRTLGSTLLVTRGGNGAQDSKGDFTLLLLADAPDNVTLSGWDARRINSGTSVVGIHHPRGDYKRITFGQTFQTPSIFDLFLPVAESQGRSQNGSSGSGLFVQPGVLIGDLSFGPKTAPGETECDMSPGIGVYQRLSDAYSDLQPFLEGNVTPPPPASDPAGGDLSLGGTDTFALDAVSSPTLFTGDFAYSVEATSDDTRITISLQAVNPANADIDLYARLGEAPAVVNGEVAADYRSEGPAGSEQIVIDASTSPSLQTGTYFIAIGTFTLNTPIEATVQVTVERGQAPPVPTGVVLTSNQPVEFNLPSVDSPTLYGGPSAYTVNVPQGATRFDVSVTTATQGADVDLYVRFGQPPEVQGGQVIADASSTSFTGDELVTLTEADGLRAGAYYVALALFSTGVSARGTLEADISTEPGGGAVSGIPIVPASPQSFSFDSVMDPTFFSDDIYRVDIGDNIARLTVDLETTTPDADMDLFVRYATPPELSNGSVLSTFSSESLTGREQIVVSAASSPPLRPGSYYIGLVLYTAGVATSGRVRVTLEQRSSSGPQVNAAVNSAGFGPGAVAPGQIISLFGVDMGPAEGIGARIDPVTGRLATSIGGVRVLFDSVAAALFFVRGDQINVQVPYGVAGRPSTNIAVIVNDRLSNALSVPVAASAPGLFMLNDGTSRIVAQNQDDSINSTSNPARRGEVVVLYATGEGLTNPPARDGGLAAGREPLQRPVLPVEVRFGNAAGEILFAGSAPGFAGLLQVNVRITTGSLTGDAVPVQLIVGGKSSQAGATISIQ